MRDFSRLVVAVLAGCAAACSGVSGAVDDSRARPEPGPPRAQADWRSLVGCYRDGDWRFALDSIPFVGVFSSADQARLLRSSRPWDRDYETSWRIIGPDSVELVFEAGLHGGVDSLAVRGDTLVGRGYTITDIVGVRPPVTKVRAVREPCPPASAFSTPLPDSAAQALLFGYGAARPTQARIDADPWGAVAPLRAWLRAHPHALADRRMRGDAWAVFRRAATADVRADARELVGTYRLEIERTGGKTLVFYGRTEIRPRFALRPADTAAVVLEQAPGYRLAFSLSRDSASLPPPGPGRRHRDAHGANGPNNSEIDVRLPATVGADGARRFRGYVLLVNFSGIFRGQDRELSTWEYEWFRRDYEHDAPPELAELVVWPDGRVTFTQREELAPDRVVTLRGERISGAAWECPRDRC